MLIDLGLTRLPCVDLGVATVSFVRIYATPVLSLTSRISISRPGQLTCLSRAAGPHVTIGAAAEYSFEGCISRLV